MSFTNCIYHIVFATSRRIPVIRQDKEREVYALLFHILNKYGCFVYRIGGMPDHIHLLTTVPPTLTVANLVQKLKRESSYFIKEQRMLPGWDGWQDGYGCFSYNIQDVEKISNYIRGQKSHHAWVSFIDEYRAWLIENGVSPDDPYFPKD